MMLPQPNATVVRRVGATPPRELSTSAITLSELLYGAERRRSQRLLHLIPQIMARLRVIPFDEPAAHVFGPLKAQLERGGTPLAEPDLRIASIALANRLIVVTNNVRHFGRVPGLTVENWLAP